MALGWKAPPFPRGTSEMAADHPHHGNGLARDDLVLRLYSQVFLSNDCFILLLLFC